MLVITNIGLFRVSDFRPPLKLADITYNRPHPRSRSRPQRQASTRRRHRLPACPSPPAGLPSCQSPPASHRLPVTACPSARQPVTACPSARQPVSPRTMAYKTRNGIVLGI